MFVLQVTEVNSYPDDQEIDGENYKEKTTWLYELTIYKSLVCFKGLQMRIWTGRKTMKKTPQENNPTERNFESPDCVSSFKAVTAHVDI